MTDVTPAEPDGIDLLMASLRAEQADVAVLFDALRMKLHDALGERVTILDTPERRRHPATHTVAVSLGDHVFEASLATGALTLLDRQRVHGVTLRSDELDLAAWIEQLVAALRAEAARSEASRAALERLLIQ